LLKWWRDFVGGPGGFRAALKYSARLGRIYHLRDKGRLEEALSQALALGVELKTSTGGLARIDIVMVAAVDEIAQRLDRHHVARDALVAGIAAIEKLTADPPPNPELESQLEPYHRRFRYSLDKLA